MVRNKSNASEKRTLVVLGLAICEAKMKFDLACRLNDLQIIFDYHLFSSLHRWVWTKWTERDCCHCWECETSPSIVDWFIDSFSPGDQRREANRQDNSQLVFLFSFASGAHQREETTNTLLSHWHTYLTCSEGGKENKKTDTRHEDWISLDNDVLIKGKHTRSEILCFRAKFLLSSYRDVSKLDLLLDDSLRPRRVWCPYGLHYISNPRTDRSLIDSNQSRINSDETYLGLLNLEIRRKLSTRW